MSGTYTRSRLRTCDILIGTDERMTAGVVWRFGIRRIRARIHALIQSPSYLGLAVPLLSLALRLRISIVGQQVSVTQPIHQTPSLERV